jgi:hypothetical protein
MLRAIAMTILSCAPVSWSSFGLAAAQGVDEIVAHAAVEAQRVEGIAVKVQMLKHEREDGQGSHSIGP